MTDPQQLSTWEFTITREDYYEALKEINRDLSKNRNHYPKQHTWHEWVNLLIIFIMSFAIGIAFIMLDKTYGQDLIVAMAGLILFLVVGVIALTKFSLISYKNYPRDQGPCLGHFKIIVNNTHMKITNPLQTSLTSLDAIFKIETNQSQILVFLDPHLAFPIPKRDIGDEAACQRLIEALTPRK